MDRARIRAEQRALYEAGEYHALSATLRPVAAELVRAAGVTDGHRVLDVGAGDGNLAIEAATTGARAVGCDLSPLQVSRAAERDPRPAWVVADAEELPFADDTFDAVVSAFGAVFAPDPQRATAELFRVAVPGGTVALTAWADDGLMGELTAALRTASAAPELFPDQDLGWGSPVTAHARFSAHSSSVAVHRRTLVIDPAVRGAAGEQDCVTRYLAPRMPTADLARARADVVRRHACPDGRLRSDYLVVVGRATR